MSRTRMACYMALALGVAWLFKTEYSNTPGGGVEIAFPLAGGDHAVLRGGYTLMFNHHRLVKEQAWAMDVARPFGFQELAAILQGKVDGFRAFGETVYAPCDGQILALVDGQPDRPPGEMDSSAPAGNHLVIACETTPPTTVRLAHLKNQSAQVAVNQAVRTGDVLAAVGNSGLTNLPHLHIEAQDAAGEAIPLLYGGRFYRGYSRFSDVAATASRE